MQNSANRFHYRQIISPLSFTSYSSLLLFGFFRYKQEQKRYTKAETLISDEEIFQNLYKNAGIS